MKKIKICHLITCLNVGGAENMLYKLVSKMDRENFNISVISMMDVGEIGTKIQALGIPVYCLNMQKDVFKIKTLVKYFRLIKRLQPNILHSWMYHANLLGYIGRLFFLKYKLYWNIRHSLTEMKNEKKITRFIIKLSALVSKKIECIVYNSKISIQQHCSFGFSLSNSQFVSNGFDAELFKPSAVRYKLFREEQAWQASTKIVGIFARYHPMKAHKDFILAAAQLKSLYKGNIKFIMAGNRIDKSNNELTTIIEQLKLEDDIILLGNINSALYMPVIDTLISSSVWGEAFSNVLGEAMLSGVPCVATDVGDAGIILGKHGHIVPRGQIEQLTEKVLALLNLSEVDKKKLAQSCRRHIIENYSLSSIVEQYQNLYLSILGN